MIKLKFKQRIAVGYYKTKFKALGLVNAEKAAEQAFLLFCTPYSGKPKRKAPPVFHHGEKISIVSDGLTIRGWRWASHQPNAKKILVVHGFDSCSYKFEKYIIGLKTRGFEVYAFDAPAHGCSEGKYFTALAYAKALQQIIQQYGPFYGAIGHSVGALALSLAAESAALTGKLVLIAPATETITAIQNFLKVIPLTPVVEKAFMRHIEEYAQEKPSFFSVARAVYNIALPILWVHDENDLICPITDVQPVLNNPPPDLQFMITRHLGHNKIYRDENVFQHIISYFDSK
ncbi:MAG: alpha/beta fold hydrolase [Sphingobacteriia bacterium]|nr:alpha/beta fold hydrolase [Sphingobacteriia bacterium]